MTRPPNKRVSRGRPVRRAGGPAKKSGCLALLLVAAPILAVLVAVVAFGTSRLDMAASHGGMAINGAPMVHADAGNSVGTASGLVFIGLGFAFLFVSLALAPLAPRHRPLRIARASGVPPVAGDYGGTPTNSRRPAFLRGGAG